MWERVAGTDVCFTPGSFGQANYQVKGTEGGSGPTPADVTAVPSPPPHPPTPPLGQLQSFEHLLTRLHRSVPRGSSVTELYAGGGVIGLTLASGRASWRVKCVEVNRACQLAFQMSRERLPAGVQGAVSWHCADASAVKTGAIEVGYTGFGSVHGEKTKEKGFRVLRDRRVKE